MPDPNDRFDLQRFLDAQRRDYDRAVSELRGGEKRSHWIWYIFPQISGLGQSAMSVRYAIGSLDEARAYLAHPILAERLIACTALVLDAAPRPIGTILPHPDDLKFRSSMTLFEAVATPPSPFSQALDVFFDGARDQATLRILRRG
jgi:uncharacterized protein (DUF1810 family)